MTRAQLDVAIGKKKAAVYKRIQFAVINAIPHEYAATIAIFGDPEIIPIPAARNYKIEYVTLTDKLGSEFYVALAGTTGQGIAQAAAATAQLINRCGSIRKVLLIGIAAGQPNLTDKEKDIRLGDVVIGDKMVQYDHVKRTNGKVEIRGDNIAPGDKELMGAVDRLRSLQERRESHRETKPWDRYLATGAKGVRNSNRPSQAEDPHSLTRVYTEGLVYERPTERPFLHVGTVGSASTLLKDAVFRDALNRDLGTVAYEMEGAGVAIAAAAAGVGYLNIRGICDYGDSDKSDSWQTYASVCAAAVARALLESF